MATKAELEEAYPISIATEADIASMISVYKAAFGPNRLNAVMFAKCDPLSLDSWIQARFIGHFKMAERRHFMIKEKSSGKVVAFCRWEFPHVLTEEEKAERQAESDRSKAAGKSEWPEGADLELVAIQFGVLDGYREKYSKGETMYLAHLLATDPAYQRKGFGSRLLKHVLDIADSEGRIAYIEATPDGHPVYEKLGFKDVDSWAIDGKKWGVDEVSTHFVMLRDPAPKA